MGHKARREARRYWVLMGGLALLFVLSLVVAGIVQLPRQAAHAAAGDWPTFLGSNARTGYNGAETAITPATAPNLKLEWTYSTKGHISAEPSAAGGQLYWGSWDGNEYATDLKGNKIWAASIGGQTPNCSKTSIFGVASTAAIADVMINGTMTTVDFVGGQNDTLYALNATTGAIIWQTQINPASGSFSWSSPAVYNGSVYIGVASVDDCPLVQGALVQVDEATGAIEHTFDVVPNGCLGGSIWSTPAVDEAAGTIFVTTGNYGKCPTSEIYAPAMIELNASDLSLIDYWQVPKPDQVVDSDFGATPTLFTATYGGSTHEMVGAQNKNGTYYVFDRSSLHSGPVWTATISTNHTSISSSAWDGTTLYVAGRDTTIAGKSCKGSLRALNPASGAFIWEDCLNDGGVLAPVSAVPGVVFAGEGTHFLAIEAATGHILFNYVTNGLVYGGSSISNGTIYVGNNGGTLYAFGLPNQPPPSPSPSPSPSTTVTPAPGTTLAQDTFHRPDQSLWGTASDGQVWGADANTLSNFSIINDSGQVVGSGSSARGYTGVLGPTASDAEVQVSGSLSSFGGNTLGAVLRWGNNNNYYKALINGSKLIILKKVNGTITQLGSASFSATAGTSYTLLFSVSGSSLNASAWPTSGSPPNTWMVSTTDGSLTGAGNCGVLVYLAPKVTADVTYFQATSVT